MITLNFKSLLVPLLTSMIICSNILKSHGIEWRNNLVSLTSSSNLRNRIFILNSANKFTSSTTKTVGKSPSDSFTAKKSDFSSSRRKPNPKYRTRKDEKGTVTTFDKEGLEAPRKSFAPIPAGSSGIVASVTLLKG